MNDISKCFGRKCRRKKTCWRYTAPASKWQSYADFDKNKRCRDYLDTRGLTDQEVRDFLRGDF